MNIRFQSGYILVISPTLVTLFGIVTGRPQQSKGAAFFPFIFVRSEEFIQPWLIMHERIHFRQQLELLFIGTLLLQIIETFIAVIVLRKTWHEAYLWTSMEQEAYLNHHDGSYLKVRKPYAQLRYLFHKRNFILVAPGVIQFRD